MRFAIALFVVLLAVPCYADAPVPPPPAPPVPAPAPAPKVCTVVGARKVVRIERRAARLEAILKALK